MLTKQQYQKLQGMGLTSRQLNQVVQAGGGLEQDKSLGGFAGNVVKSGANLVGNTAGAILNPIQTVQNLISVVKDPKVLIDYYKQRYGKDLATTLYEDPVGVLADLSAIAGGVGGVIKGVGTVGRLESVANLGGKIGRVANAIDPLSAVGRTVVGGANKVLPKVAGALESESSSVLTRGAGNPLQQKNFQIKYGETVGDFMKRKNLYDRSSSAFSDLEKKLLGTYNEKAMSSSNMVDLNTLVDDFAKKEAEIVGKYGKNSPATKTRVAILRQQFNEIASQLGQNGNEVPVSELTRYRREAVDPNIAKSEFGVGQKSVSKSKGYKDVRDILRKNINATDAELEQTGLDIGKAKEAGKIFKSAEARSQARQPINFTRLGGAGVGSLIAGVPGAIAGFAGEQIINSPKVLSATSRGLSKASKLFNKKVVVPKSVKVGYDVARTGRVVNGSQSRQSPQKQQTSKVSPQLSSPSIPLSQGAKVKINPIGGGKNPFKAKKVVKGSFY